MVCVPCFIIPVLLYIWHKFIQPYFLRYIWNPWQKKDAQGNVIDNTPAFPFECKGGVCPYPGAKEKLDDPKKDDTTAAPSETKTTVTSSDSKKDD